MHDPIITAFLDGIAADPVLAPHAAELEAGLAAVDMEGDGNTDAAVCFEGVHWIIKQQSCSLDERVKALHRLFSLPRGPVKVNLRRDGSCIILRELL